MFAYIPLLLSCAALLLTAYFAFRKEGQEEKQANAARLSKLEVEQANQIARQQGFQAEIEGVADHAKRERQTIVENATRDHNSLREMIKDVPSMRDLLSRMDERYLSTKDEMKGLKEKLDKIFDLLSHK